MTPDFEKQMREKLEHASPGSLLDGFDIAAAWQGISEKIAPAAEKKRGRLWWSHIAAALCGVILVCIFWAARQHDAPPAYTVVRDTIYRTRDAVAAVPAATSPQMQVQQPAPTSTGNTQPGRPKPLQQAPVLVQVPGNTMPLPADTPTGGIKEQVAAAPVSTGVVHMLDMNNEDRDIARNATPVALGSHPVKLNTPGTTYGNTPYAVQAVIKSFTSNK